MTGEEASAAIVVNGVVQGVGYRHFTIQAARNLGLAGWVGNRADGSVELEVEGERRRITALIQELKIGPRWAQVKDIKVEWGTSRGQYRGFDVRF
ncbi:acylphosphatase [candidate division KSB1 bacterium]